MSESFDPAKFQLSPEELEEMKANGDRLSAISKPPKRAKKPYFLKFEENVIDGLNEANYPPVWPLMAAILEILYEDREKKNPVRLTSTKLKKYRISKDQKARALQALEEIGLLEVERISGQNPLVYMTWELPKG